jgi:hypothetical protein
MKSFQKQMLAAALLAALGLGLSLLNNLRPIAGSQPASIGEPDRNGITPAATDATDKFEDKSQPANVESKKNMARARFAPGGIRQWGLESWSRLRHRLRRRG